MMICEGTSEASAEEPEFHDARSWLSRLSVGSSVGSSVFADDPAADHHELDDPSLPPAVAWVPAEPPPSEKAKATSGPSKPPPVLLPTSSSSPSPDTSPREHHRLSLMDGINSMLGGWRSGLAHHGASAHRHNDATPMSSNCGTPVPRNASLCRQLQASPPPWAPPHPLRSLGKCGHGVWMGGTDH